MELEGDEVLAQTSPELDDALRQRNRGRALDSARLGSLPRRHERRRCADRSKDRKGVLCQWKDKRERVSGWTGQAVKTGLTTKLLRELLVRSIPELDSQVRQGWGIGSVEGVELGRLLDLVLVIPPKADQGQR